MAAGRYLSCTPRHAFSEADLLEEIAYHETMGRIMPRARRHSTVSPRIAYRKNPG